MPIMELSTLQRTLLSRIEERLESWTLPLAYAAGYRVQRLAGLGQRVLGVRRPGAGERRSVPPRRGVGVGVGGVPGRTQRAGAGEIGPVRVHGGDVCGRVGVFRVRPQIHTPRMSRIVRVAEPSGYHACSSPGVAGLGKQPDHGLCGAACRNRTDDLLITSEMSTTSKKLHPNRFEYKFPSYAINLPYGVARTPRRRTIRGGHRVARRTVPTGCRVVPGGSTKGWHASRRSPCPR